MKHAYGELAGHIISTLADHPEGLTVAQIADLMNSDESGIRRRLAEMTQDHTVLYAQRQGMQAMTFRLPPPDPMALPISAQARGAMRVLPSLQAKTYKHLAAQGGYSYPVARAIWAELQACGVIR